MLPVLPVRRVLIADDDPAVRGGVADVLSGIGLEILEAESGLQALEILRPRLRFAAHDPALDLEPIHLLVLDVQMPGLGGLELLFELRALAGPRRLAPAIVCSGSTAVGLESRALEAGAAEFLRKPLMPDELRGAVHRVLGPPPDASDGPGRGPGAGVG